jgi:hypothetical protein
MPPKDSLDEEETTTAEEMPQTQRKQGEPARMDGINKVLPPEYSLGPVLERFIKIRNFLGDNVGPLGGFQKFLPVTPQSNLHRTRVVNTGERCRTMYVVI